MTNVRRRIRDIWRKLRLLGLR